MRLAFVRALIDLARHDRRVVLLTGDLGYGVIEPFAREFPERFFNIGVAEQNMIGVATGLADSGFIPFAYSIATFASLRAYEFLRNGPVLHDLKVRVVGVGGGFEYGHAGMTHHSLEDVAVMRVQPGLTVLTPADSGQAEACLRTTWDRRGPIYYRIGKNENAVVPGLDGRFTFGGIDYIGAGTDAIVLAMGASAVAAVEAKSALEDEGIRCTVGVIATVSPPPAEELSRVFERFGVVVTVEAHYLVGGLASLVAEAMSRSTAHPRLISCGVAERVGAMIGSQSFLDSQHGISKQQIASAVRSARYSAA